MPINATNPVVVAPEQGATYNEWYMVMLLVNATPEAAPAQVRLQRSYTDDKGVVHLMPGPLRDSQVTLNLDLFQASQGTPAIATALGAVVAAVEAYGAAQGVL